MKKVLLEGLFIAVAGALLALCANALSPRGLSLTQDFFHSQNSAPGSNSLPAAPSSNQAATMALSNHPLTSGTTADWQELATKVKASGLALIDGERALELYNDPRRAQNFVIFIDARQYEGIGQHGFSLLN